MFSSREKNSTYLWIFLLAVIVYFLISIFVGCTSVQKTETPQVLVPTIVSSPVPSPQASYLPIPTKIPIPSFVLPALSWENTSAPHPERKAWSLALFKYFDEKFEHISKAKDIKLFCPKYELLPKMQQLNVWAELFVALSYAESSWHPSDSSVDVGDEGDQDTYSVGLFSMSVIDQQSYNLPLGYHYNDLITPEPNIRLAVYIMSQQIDKIGVIIPPSRKNLYWVTLYKSVLNRYDQSDDIINKVKKLSFCK